MYSLKQIFPWYKESVIRIFCKFDESFTVHHYLKNLLVCNLIYLKLYALINSLCDFVVFVNKHDGTLHLNLEWSLYLFKIYKGEQN